MKEFKQTTALWSWSGNYPTIHDRREFDDEVQELLHRAVYQGDENCHWFCSCDEFQGNLSNRANGTLSSIANEKPLECVHIRKIMQEKGLQKNKIPSP